MKSVLSGSSRCGCPFLNAVLSSPAAASASSISSIVQSRVSMKSRPMSVFLSIAT